MILIECPTCNRRELASTRRIESIVNTADGIVVAVRCSAGHLHQTVTGARRPTTDVTEAPAELAEAC